MAGLLTLVISFLARLVGLGRVSDAIKGIIDRIRDSNLLEVVFTDSILSVISVSTSSGEAPGSLVRTMTAGKSIFGN